MRLRATLLAALGLLLAGCGTTPPLAITGDVQDNFFSITPGGTGVGIGGKNPLPLPAGDWPKNLIFDPSNPSSQVPLGGNPATPGSYDAILKISDLVSNLTLNGVRCAQGVEDSLNLNNQDSRVFVSGDYAVSGAPGLRVITVKGGCAWITITGVLHGHGTSEDIKIGDWSDQCYAPSVNIDIAGLREDDGSKIKVIEGNCQNVILGPNETLDVPDSESLKLYVEFKKTIRDILKIPVGTPGPAWLP